MCLGYHHQMSFKMFFSYLILFYSPCFGCNINGYFFFLLQKFFALCSLSVGGSGDQGFLESSFLGSDDDTSCILRHWHHLLPPERPRGGSIIQALSSFTWTIVTFIHSQAKCRYKKNKSPGTRPRMGGAGTGQGQASLEKWRLSWIWMSVRS